MTLTNSLADWCHIRPVSILNIEIVLRILVASSDSHSMSATSSNGSEIHTHEHIL